MANNNVIELFPVQSCQKCYCSIQGASASLQRCKYQRCPSTVPIAIHNSWQQVWEGFRDVQYVSSFIHEHKGESCHFFVLFPGCIPLTAHWGKLYQFFFLNGMVCAFFSFIVDRPVMIITGRQQARETVCVVRDGKWPRRDSILGPHGHVSPIMALRISAMWHFKPPAPSASNSVLNQDQKLLKCFIWHCSTCAWSF